MPHPKQVHSNNACCNPPKASVSVFHPLANAHAGRTTEKPARIGGLFIYLFVLLLILAYLAGRTSTCMKLSCALMLVRRMIVPVFGVITLPQGLAGS
jgi:hypothetical protein